MKKKIVRASSVKVGWLGLGLLSFLILANSRAEALDFLDEIAGLTGSSKAQLENSVRQAWSAVDTTLLQGAEVALLQGVVSAGIFEHLSEDGQDPAPQVLDRIAQVAARAGRALAVGLPPDAIEELAQAALGADLSDARFQAAAGALHRLDQGGVPAGVIRSWLGYALDEGWSAELLTAAADGIVRAIDAGLDPEQMALALSVAVAQAEPGRSPQSIVQGELDFLQDPVDSAEKTRRSAIYQALRTATAAGLPRSVAYGLYEHALLEEWPATLTSAVFQGVQQGVGQGLPSENLALALVVRIEQEGRQAPVDQLIADEIAFVRRQFNLPEAAPEDTSSAPIAPPDPAPSTPAESPAKDPSPPFPSTPTESPATDPSPAPPSTPAPTPPAQQPPATPVAPPESPAPSVPDQGTTGVALAQRVSWTRLKQSVDSFLGVPYLWGGETRQGTDCSGFTQTIYSEQGVQIPRVSRDQHGFLARHKALVDDGDSRSLRTGDLVFFNKNGQGRITHVGVYMGADKFAHASSSKGVVISDLSVRYYQRLFAAGGSVCQVR